MSALTIPASQLVSVTPNVLAAGGSALDLSAVVLTTNTRVPVGTVPSFPDAISVSNYFGPSAKETSIADVYFAGFDNSNKKPGALLFSQYPTSPVAAYLRSASLAAMTIAQLQAIKPASVTASIGGSVTAAAGATFTGSAAGTVLTASGVTGLISVGDVITGVGVPAGTFITSLGTGTGGAGTYNTNQATTASAASLTGTSTVLNVTAVASGSLQTTDVLSGTGVTSGTAITGQLSGSAGSTGTYRMSGAAQQFASTTVTSLSTVMKVTAVGSGALAVGQLLSGSNVTALSRVAAQLTGTAGSTGLYSVSLASTAASTTVTAAYDLSVTVNGSVSTSASIDLSAATSFSAAAVTIGSSISQSVVFDSVSSAFVITSPTTGAASTIGFGSGGLATALSLTAALGALTSQGANALTPSAAMDAIVGLSQNWASFMLAFDPDGGSGNAQKLLFATWAGQQNDRYAFVCWDTDITPTTTLPATASLGYLLNQAGTSGTILIYEATDLNLAAFVCGMIASIDFTETNGRITLAYKSQSGLVPSVTSGVIAENLGGNPQSSGRGNGYNFYGGYATADQTFTFFQRGFVSGKFLWADSFVNQIWLTNSFQLAILLFLSQVKSVPYNAAGYAAIRAACQDVITAGLNFGAFSGGVPLSASQASQVDNAAGVKISDTLATQGWYLQIKPAAPSTRAGRTSPPITFWYMDAGSVQSINLTSVTVQ